MITKKMIDDLANLELTLHRAILISLFGDVNGNYLWEVFMEADESLLRFWDILGPEQKGKLLDYINTINNTPAHPYEDNENE